MWVATLAYYRAIAVMVRNKRGPPSPRKDDLLVLCTPESMSEEDRQSVSRVALIVNHRLILHLSLVK